MVRMTNTFVTNVEAAPDDIIEFCKSRMASYKYPRRVEIRTDFPRGPTGKVVKTELGL